MHTADVPGNLDTTGKLKVMVKIVKDGPDPTGLSRWDVFAKRYMIFDVSIGTVIAGGREEALELAQRQYPHEKRISVSPATSD